MVKAKGKTLQQRIEAMGYTHARLAALLRRDKASIYRWAHGRKESSSGAAWQFGALVLALEMLEEKERKKWEQTLLPVNDPFTE